MIHRKVIIANVSSFVVVNTPTYCNKFKGTRMQRKSMMQKARWPVTEWNIGDI